MRLNHFKLLHIEIVIAIAIESLNPLSSKPIFNFNVVQILKIRYIISH
jgi:hypothetical protein